MISNRYLPKCVKIVYNKLVRKGERSMKAKYDVIELADKIVNMSNEMGFYITNLQLQKIMYYVQGGFLRQFGYKAFLEPIECWPYGPAIKKVWRKYNSFGRRPIIVDVPSSLILDEQEESCILDIIKSKLCMNVWALVDQTHEELPWQQANLNNNSVISDADMEAFFCR